MTDDSTIPVKAHNTRDALTGILFISSFAERSTEVGAERLAHQRAMEARIQYIPDASDRRERVQALKREADRLADLGKIGIDWRARYRWIAGAGGFSLREVCLYLGKT